MKPIRSSLLSLAAALMLLPLSGCGGGTDTDPQQVLDTALSSESLLAPPVGPGEVEVASLGFEDAVLDRQILTVDRETNVAVRKALAGSVVGSADGEDPATADGEKLGLVALVGDLQAQDPTGIDGVQVEHITGSIDVAGLIDRIRPLAESQTGGGASDEIPGVGRLNQLEQSLVAADFGLFASESDGSLERFDLILALDDPGNSLPPSRIRFSLTDAGGESRPLPGQQSGQGGQPQ